MVSFFNNLSSDVIRLDNLITMKDISFRDETTIDAPDLIVDGVRYVASNDPQVSNFITQAYTYRGI